jgi:hypothetical protein
MAKEPISKVKATGKIAPKPPKKVDPETAKETKRLPPKKVDTLKATKADDKKSVKGAKVAAGKVVGQKTFKYVGFDPSSTIKTKKKTGGGGGGGGGDKPKIIKDATDVSTGTISNSSGLVDDVNYKEQFFAEAKRLVLSLVYNAKDLLIRYNFSSINSISDYYLDADREAISQAVVSGLARPEPPFGPQEALQQDKFSFSVNEINNKISDTVSDIDKNNYFGTQRGDVFHPQRVRISSGVTYYDMRLEFDSIYDKNDYVIRCYEIS